MKINGFLKWVLFTVFFEILLLFTVWVFIYSNYEKLTKEKSTIEFKPVQKVKLELKADINNYKIKTDTNKFLYSWYFGKVVVWDIQTWSSLFNQKIREVKDVALDYNRLSYTFMLNNLLDKWKIDIYMYNYFKNKWYNIFIKFYQNQEIISKYIDWFDISIDQKYIDSQFQEIKKLITEKEYSELIEYLNDLEKKVNTYQSSDKYKKYVFTPTFFYDQDFNYIISKLYWQDSIYKKYIDECSKMFGYNKNLLIWSITAEQMRWFYTERGQLKSILQKADLLVINNKFSFGIWWVKINTAQNIEKDLQSYNADLYSKIFSKDTNDIHTRLTQTDDFQIYYPWALVYNILTRRKLKWMDISDNPWVVATLYNFGNLETKEPHDKPGIWWAVLDINWVNYTFGGLGMMVFYIMEFYY